MSCDIMVCVDMLCEVSVTTFGALCGNKDGAQVVLFAGSSMSVSLLGVMPTRELLSLYDDDDAFEERLEESMPIEYGFDFLSEKGIEVVVEKFVICDDPIRIFFRPSSDSVRAELSNGTSVIYPGDIRDREKKARACYDELIGMGFDVSEPKMIAVQTVY